MIEEGTLSVERLGAVVGGGELVEVKTGGFSLARDFRAVGLEERGLVVEGLVGVGGLAL